MPFGGCWLDALPHPVVALDLAGAVIGLNPAAAALLGHSEDQLFGRQLSTAVLPPEDTGGFDEALGLALTGGRWSGEMRLTDDVGTRRVRVEIAPAYDGGTLAGAVVTVDHPDGSEDDRLSARRLGRLARVVAEMQAAEDVVTLTDVVVAHMADAAGATTASLSVIVEPGTLAMIGIRGGVEGAAATWATYAVDERTPAGVAVLEQQPMLLVGRDAITSRFPDLPLAAEGERSILCLPLLVAERTVGVATLSFPGRPEIDAAELDFYRLLGDSCAQALERLWAQETVAEQHHKLTVLADATAELASSLDYESTLRNVAWLAIPEFADWCAIALEQDSVLRTLAVAHRDPDKIALAERLQQQYPSDPASDEGSYAVLRSGESTFVPEIPPELLDSVAKDETHRTMLRELDLASGMTVPLTARGRVFGTASWFRGRSRRRFNASDLVFGEDLARRAGVAIDNAHLHSELREVADRLQQAVAPSALPQVAGWELRASYSSAGHADVGGDFYETLPLPDGRLALAMGDVMGRGVQAAAAMAQVRAALRAFIAVDPDPASVMTRLDVFYEQFPTEQLVTLLYGVADPAFDLVTLVSAGHPPPLLLDPEGGHRFLDEAQGSILGVEPARRTSVVVPFTAGQTLLLFTDGLLERRDEDLQRCFDRLADSADRLGLAGPEPDLDSLVTSMCDPSRDDDVAVLLARRTRA